MRIPGGTLTPASAEPGARPGEVLLGVGRLAAAFTEPVRWTFCAAGFFVVSFFAAAFFAGAFRLDSSAFAVGFFGAEGAATVFLVADFVEAALFGAAFFATGFDGLPGAAFLGAAPPAEAERRADSFFGTASFRSPAPRAVTNRTVRRWYLPPRWGMRGAVICEARNRRHRRTCQPPRR
jgi:hypothetical protein